MFNTPKTAIIPPSRSLQELQNLLQGRVSALVCDEHTYSCCLPLITQLNTLPSCVLRAGEMNKNMEQVLEICSFLQQLAHPRSGLLISLGGGVVSDLAGMAASIYKRGISVIHIPSTLMGMVDAATGGKTGVNFNHVRNALGSVYFPEAVLIFPGLLKTLHPNELLSGMAEMHKHAFIASEEDWKRACGASQEDFLNAETIYWHAQFKQKLIEKDPFDKAERQKLNLGHTSAHAFESAFLEQGIEIPHGFAVSAGLSFEAQLAFAIGSGISEAEVNRITGRMQQFFPKLPLVKLSVERVLEFMRNDKKNTNGIVFTLPVAPGEILIGVEVDELIIKKQLHLFIHA